MNVLRVSLFVSTIGIYAITIVASLSQGINWPALAISDIMELGWRSQFDIDFLIHLFLLAAWVVWREGADGKAYVFGFLSVVMGGMFTFPYVLYASYKAKGKVGDLLLGIHR